jgi:uncharacterized protein YndB with AHSA1/START domain
MSNASERSSTVQVYRVYIKAKAQAIWDAITKPEWVQKYGYACRAEFDLRPGGAYRAFATDAMKAQGAQDVLIVGEVIEADPPRKLVQTWHPIWDPTTAAETPSRLTYLIEEQPGGMCKLTLTHDLAGAPSLVSIVNGDTEQAGGGWSFVLSDLKTLLETGKALAA